MDLEESALAGVSGGTVAGALHAAFATAAYLLFRRQVLAETRAALESEQLAGAGMDATTLYWVNLVAVPPTLLVFGIVAGTVVAVPLAWRGGESTPVVAGVALLVGVGNGLITQLPGVGRPAIVAASVVAWLGYAGVYRRVVAGDGDLDGVVPDRSVDWRTVIALTAAGGIGVLSLVPALLATDAPVAAAGNLLVVGAMVVAAVFVGAWLGPSVGLGAPALSAWFDGDPPAARPLAAAAGVGAATGAVLLVLDAVVFGPLVAGAVRDATAGLGGVPGWARLLAGLLYGGVVEELLLRYGLVTGLVWLGWRAGLRDGDRPARGVIPAAIVVAALTFGVLHLPATAASFALTPAVVARALVLNGIAGVVFGWLYWRRGLLAAMAAHAGANVVLQGVAVLLA